MVTKTKTGRLSPEAERRLTTILDNIRSDSGYYVRDDPMMSGDLSKELGRIVEVKSFQDDREIIKVKTHYEGEGRRYAVYDALEERRIKCNPRLQALDSFLREEGYEMRKHEVKKEEEKDKKDKRKK